MVGCHYFKHQEMQGLPLAELLTRLRLEHDIDPYVRYPPSSMLGVLMKKKLFPHVGHNPQTGQAVPTIRARLEARAFDWSKMGELRRTELLMAKLWEQEHPASLELIDLAYNAGVGDSDSVGSD